VCVGCLFLQRRSAARFRRIVMKLFNSPFLFLVAAAGLLAADSDPASAPVRPEALVAEIVARHPEIAFYAAEIDAAKAGRRSAAAPADPELALELGRKRARDPAGVLAGEGTAWTVSLAQTFEWPGRLALRKAIANHEVELAELGLARFRSGLASRARVLAFGLYAANARAAAVREVADRFAALKEVFLAREPAGITPQLETRVIEAAELVLQRRATEADVALHGALLELNQLRGAAVDAPLRIAAFPLQFNEAPLSAELLASARERNFDFRIRRVELEQQGLEVRLARHERQPAVTVRPYVARESAGERETTVGLGVSLPLPVGPRSGAAAEAAESRRRQAEAGLFAAQRELERDVLTAAHAFATRVAELRRWADNSADKFREAAALADRHYRLGAVPIATYVELQHSYLEAVEARFETQRETLEAGLRLQLLTGHDFQPVAIAP
jgi:cobalt-zinc-cadmium efflux system outer membrane protein